MTSDAYDDESAADWHSTARVFILSAALAKYRTGRRSCLSVFDEPNQCLAPNHPFYRPNSTPIYVPGRPSALEISLLEILSRVYGDELLSSPVLGAVLRLIAHSGGLVVLRRVLWGEHAADGALAIALMRCAAELKQVSTAYEKELLSDAIVVLARF